MVSASSSVVPDSPARTSVLVRLAKANSYRWDLLEALPPFRRTKDRAEAEAINVAKVDGAIQERIGAVGEAEAFREKEIKVAENVEAGEEPIADPAAHLVARTVERQGLVAVDQAGADLARQLGVDRVDQLHHHGVEGELRGDAIRQTRFQGETKVLCHIPPGRVGGRLGVEAVIENPHDHLQVSLGLHQSAHHAETEKRTIVAGHKAGRYRVKRTFAATDAVGMPRFECEAPAAVLQADPCFCNDDARTKTHVVGLDVGDHHAVPVGCAQINRTAVRSHCGARHSGLIHPNLGSAVGQKSFGQQVLRVDLHGGRIGDVAPGFCKSQLHGFHL